MSSASIAVYRIQAACFVGRGDGKLAQRVREFQQLRGLGMLRDNRVGVREGSPYCAPSPWSMQRADSGKKWQKRSGSIRGALYVLFTALIEAGRITTGQPHHVSRTNRRPQKQLRLRVAHGALSAPTFRGLQRGPNRRRFVRRRASVRPLGSENRDDWTVGQTLDPSATQERGNVAPT